MSFFKKFFGKKKDEVKKEKLEEIKKELDEEDLKILNVAKEKNNLKKEENTTNTIVEDIFINQDKKIKDAIEEVLENKIEKTEEKEKKKSYFSSLKEKLFKSRDGLFGALKNILTGKTIVDGEMYEELEDVLIQSDIGMDMTLKIIKDLKSEVKARGVKEPAKVYDVLKDVLEGYLIREGAEIEIEPNKINVILIVGVNGVGKTTTIGKLASKYVKDGKKVLIGAADTFRAAAVEQLEEWSKKSGADIIKHSAGADPGAVVFDTLCAAEDKKADVVIIDTAGRLHNKNNLMKELEKINNIIKKKIGNQKYESILVIDGTTGQNGLIQARVFNEVTKLTGFIITKLDGTAKGGIVFSISEELKKPIKYIGVGEGIDDLRAFNSTEYIKAIFD